MSLTVFSLNVPDKKEILKFLLGVNDRWFFQDGRISVLHKSKYVFSSYELSSVKVKKDCLNDVSNLPRILDSKTSVVVNVFPEYGYIVQQDPLFTLKIPSLSFDKKEMQNYTDKLHELQYSGSKWKDKNKITRKVAEFSIESVQLEAMLKLVEESDMNRITFNDSLLVENVRTKEFSKKRNVEGQGRASILLGRDAYQYCLSSLKGEKTKVKIFDDSLMLLNNICKTIIAARVE